MKGWLCLLFAVLAGYAQQNDFEPLGPSSRRTGLVISEIMFHPADRIDGARLEFVELYNSNPFPEDISGYALGGLAYKFPSGTIIGSNSFLVIGRFPDDVKRVYGLPVVLGPLSNNIPNREATLTLIHRSGAVLLEATYEDRAPWPVAPDGTGHSVVLARPSFGERDPRAWAASSRVGGSPGTYETHFPTALDRVKINEFRAHSTPGEEDFIELYNYSNTSVDVSGCGISNDEDGLILPIPAGTLIGPRGFLVINESDFLFLLSGMEGKLFLWNPARDRVLDALSYRGQEQGLSTGRFPDGTAEMYGSLAPSSGMRNHRPPMPSVVINEIHYQSVLDFGSLEFIELHNLAPTKVDLTGYGMDGAFLPLPLHPVIAPKGYFVVGGWLNSQLSNSGERLALLKPIVVIEPDPVSFVLRTNLAQAVVDEVTYGTGGRWGKWSDGGGSSLEAVNPRANRRLAPAWADSEPVESDRWQEFKYTGVLDHGVGVCDGLDVMLLGRGEALLDDLHVSEEGGANLIANSTFNQSAEGWFFRGNHERSGWAQGALHIRASGRGDPGANRVNTRFASTIPPGVRATISGRFQWVRGRPTILLRLKGNYLEVQQSYRGPFREGTPNLPNSRAVHNAGPVICDVTHRPVLPRAHERVVVRARLDDADGVLSAMLTYRPDPGTARSTIPMNDAGVDGDDIADDGIYAARIPGQPAGTLVAFVIEAKDAMALSASSLFPDDRECLIRFGEPHYTNAFATYRLLMTQATHNRWAQREKLSNERLPVTLVYGDHRVIYGASAVFSGSPSTSQEYDTPTGTLCSYDLDLPDDDRLLGAGEIVLDFPTGDPTAQRQQLMHWFFEQMDLPFNYRRYINLFVNGVGQRERRGFGVAGTIYEDAQQPNSDMLREWFPGDNNGDLLKAEDWIEFSDAGNILHVTPNTLEQFTTADGEPKTARYRWNWRPRSFSLFTQPFRGLLQLVDAVSSNAEGQTHCADALIDFDSWMPTFALNDLASNWDSFGNSGGKNTFLYKPRTGRWKLLSWDFDAGLGVWGAEADAPLFDVADPTLAAIYSRPSAIRGYWRGVEEALNGFYRSDVIAAVLDGRHAALATVGAEGPNDIKAFIQDRRPIFEHALAGMQAAFAILSHEPFTILSNGNYVSLIGNAPLQAKTVTVNRRLYPVTWLDPLAWQVNLALTNGTNHLIVEGFDRFDNALPGASNYLEILYLPTTGDPWTELVLNEVLNDPPVCGAEFMELYNRSSSNAFDLGSVANYDATSPFHAGFVLRPNEFAVFAQDQWAFGDIFGCHISLVTRPPPLYDCLRGRPIWGCYWRDVCPDGFFPWPEGYFGRSLQLIDPQEQNWRPGNWTTEVPSPGRSNSVYMDLPPFPELWLNEIVPVNHTGIRDSSGTPEPWIELFYHGSNKLDLTDFRLSDRWWELNRWAFPRDSYLTPNDFGLVWLDGQTNETTAAEWHANFRPPQLGIVSLSRRVAERDIFIDQIKYPPLELVDADQVYGVPLSESGGLPHYARLSVELDYPTPLATNANIRRVTNQFLYINEWMASNTRIPDPADGDFDDWFEIFNGDPNFPVNLAGYTLTDDFSRTDKFIIPPGFTLPPNGFLLVWADEDVEQTEPGQHLHVNFRLSRSGETIALFDPAGKLMDTVTFGVQSDDVSQGRCWDGSQSIVTLSRPTPGRENHCGTVPLCPVPRLNVGFYPGAASQIWFRITNVACVGEYVLQCKDELNDPFWTDVTGGLLDWQVAVAEGWRVYWFNDFWIHHTKQRFYRVDLRARP